VKGPKGSSFISPETLELIKANTFYIISTSFLAWMVLLQMIIMFTRINILKIIVLIGTFALAMAFAGNDLVNFIGVPLAGFSSYQAFAASPGAEPTSFLMTSLTGKVGTETYLLVIAGVVMAVTLWFSRKARTVAETEINLSRQSDGDERFDSSVFSRNLVRGSMSIANTVNTLIPGFAKRFIAKRFAKVSDSKDKNVSGSSFDLMRASVNLTVASILISFATSLKLPLSTTYVTFMVAMGSSFGDGAWGRESAVYRISGVTSVIGGWFLTAFAAFVAAFSFAVIIHYGGVTAIAILVILAAVFIIKSHAFHKKKEIEKQDEQELEESTELVYADVLKKSSDHIYEVLTVITTSYREIISSLAIEDRKALKTINADVEALDKKVKKRKDKINNTIHNLREEDIEAGYFYVQILDSLREMVRSLRFISTPAFTHIDNTHKGLNPDQIAEFKKISADVHTLFKKALPLVQEHRIDGVDDLIIIQQNLLIYIGAVNKIQLKRIKHGVSGTKNGILYFAILTETKNLLLHTINLVKAKRDLILLNKQ